MKRAAWTRKHTARTQWKRHARRSGPSERFAGRGGFTLLEVVVAAGILGMVFLVTIPLLGRVRGTRAETHRRFVALQEAANLMERVALQANNGTLDEFDWQSPPVSAEAKAVLPDVAATVSRSPAGDDVGGVRVTVSVSWLDDAGKRTAPASLGAWFPVDEEQ